MSASAKGRLGDSVRAVLRAEELHVTGLSGLLRGPEASDDGRLAHSSCGGIQDWNNRAINLTNRPQFGSPNTTTGVGNFGVVNSTINSPRLIQFALRFTF